MINKFSWIFLLAGTLVMMYLMMATGKTLKTTATPIGILDLEFAHNAGKVETILNAWSVKGDSGSVIDDAKRNTYYDFIFLLFYSSFLFCSCKLLGKRSHSTPTFKKTANLFAYAALAAGFLDVLENIGMLQILHGNISDSITLFTSVSAILKWFLVILVLLFLLIRLISQLLLQNRPKL